MLRIDAIVKLELVEIHGVERVIGDGVGETEVRKCLTTLKARVSI